MAGYALAEEPLKEITQRPFPKLLGDLRWIAARRMPLRRVLPCRDLDNGRRHASSAIVIGAVASARTRADAAILDEVERRPAPPKLHNRIICTLLSVRETHGKDAVRVVTGHLRQH